MKQKSSNDCQDLLLCQEIFHTHIDFDFGHEIIVGFDEFRDLKILWIHYEHSSSRLYKQVIVKKEDAYRLAQQLQIPMTELPTYISDKFSDLDSFEGREYIESLLSAILDYLLSLKVHYQIKS